jgi:hypothetical protein
MLAILFLALYFAGGGFVGVWMIREGSVIGYCVALHFFTVFVLMSSNSLSAEMKAYHQGLKIRSATRHFFVNWHDIQQSDFLTKAAYNQGETLYKLWFTPSNYTDYRIGGRLSWLFVWSYDPPKFPIQEFVEIPMIGSQIDYDEFAKTEFGSILKVHVPHLFEEGKRK